MESNASDPARDRPSSARTPNAESANYGVQHLGSGDLVNQGNAIGPNAIIYGVGFEAHPATPQPKSPSSRAQPKIQHGARRRTPYGRVGSWLRDVVVALGAFVIAHLKTWMS